MSTPLLLQPLPPLALLQAGASGRPQLQPPKQNQDQHDDQHQSKTAAAVISSPIERASADSTEAAEQGDYQNNEQNGSERHAISNVALFNAGCAMWFRNELAHVAGAFA
jgi:hypothetical protein